MITIDLNRIITNQDLANRDIAFQTWFNEIGINPSSNVIEISSGFLLIINPTYLADIYNENDEKEQYLKQNGVLLTDFGGDVGGPVYRTEESGIKVLLVFDRVNFDGRPIFKPGDNELLNEGEILNDRLGCDSGSYIFLDYCKKLSLLFQDELEKYKNYAALVEIPKGYYRIGYEQWETNEENPYEAWRRNLVAIPIIE
jgi:hypothetical protein